MPTPPHSRRQPFSGSAGILPAPGFPPSWVSPRSAGFHASTPKPFPCSGRSLACPELRRARPDAGRDRCLCPQRRSCARPLGLPGIADLPIGSWVSPISALLPVALAFMPALRGYGPNQKHPVILSNAKDLNPRVLPPPFLHAPAASLFLVAPASCRLSGFPGSPISRSALGFLPVALASRPELRRVMPALWGYGPDQKHPVILSNAKDLNPRVLPPPFLHVLHAPASSLFLVAPASCRLPGFLLFGILLVALAFMPAPWGYRPNQKHPVILSNAKDLNRRVLPPSFQHAPAVCLSPLRSPLLSAHSAVIFFLRLPR